MIRTVLAVALVATCACEAQLFELDAGYSGRALCVDVRFDLPPRCPDGGIFWGFSGCYAADRMGTEQRFQY